MEVKDIIKDRDRCHCGDTVESDNPAEPGSEIKEAWIQMKYPKFAVLTNGKYRWCKNWIDLMKHNP